MRAEQALVDATLETAFVEASGYATFADLLEWCEPARTLGRAECPPLTGRLIISAVARSDPSPETGEGALKGRVRGHATNPFGTYSLEPAFARAAHELFQSLALQGATPEHLEQAAEGKTRALYLARLWREYRSRLATLGLADRAELLAAATRRLREEIPLKLKAFSAIEIHHVYDLPPLRLDFIDALARAFRRDFRTFVLHVPAANNPALDALGDEVLRRFERDWAEAGAEVYRAVRPSPLARAVERMFGSGEPREAVSNLEVVSAPSPREEVAGIAERVRSLIDSGTAPEEIAVVYRDLASEAESLVETLEELAVPSRVRLGVPLRATAVGRLALELPRMVDERFPAGSVTRFLESRYAGAVFDADLDPVTLLQEAGVRDDVVGAEGGRGAYSVRLEMLAARAHNPRKQDHARRLASRAQRLITLGNALEDEAEAKVMLDAWWGALESLGLFASLRRHERDDTQGQLGRFVERALARDQAAAEALRYLRDDLASSLRDAGLETSTITRRDFSRWLDEAAAAVNLLPRGPRSGAVELLEARALPGRHFTHVFVGGLNDGRFPARPPPMPLISEEERKELNRAAKFPLFRLWAGEAGAGLPFRQAEDRLLFSLALNAGEGVTLSAPRYDSIGRELLRSAFLTELERVTTGARRVAVAKTSVAPLERVATEADLRARVALEVLSRPATRLSQRSALAFELERKFGDQAWLARARVLARIEEQRDDFFNSDVAPGRFTGGVSLAEQSDEVRAMLSFDRAHPAHATIFSVLANCHFEGAAQLLLRLSVLEEATEEPDARTRGTFWHQVLQHLLPLVKARGWTWGSLKEKKPEEVQQLIDEAIDTAAEAVGPRGHPALWKLGRDGASRAIRRLLFSDGAGLPFAGHEPVDAEITFGTDKSPEPWKEAVIPPAFDGELPIHLTGKIDRVDRHGDSIGVVDYKSGARSKTLRAELLQTAFQLPFYVAAAASAYPGAAIDAAELTLRDRETQKLSKLLPGPLKSMLAADAASRAAAARDGKPNLPNAAHTLVTSLRQGDFGARSRDCRRCAYRSVCRIRQRVIPESPSW